MEPSDCDREGMKVWDDNERGLDRETVLAHRGDDLIKRPELHTGCARRRTTNSGSEGACGALAEGESVRPGGTIAVVRGRKTTNRQCIETVGSGLLGALF